MESISDTESRSSQDAPRKDEGAGDKAEENKFQKAIGAWRSTCLCRLVAFQRTDREPRHRSHDPRSPARHGSLGPGSTPEGHAHPAQRLGTEDERLSKARRRKQAQRHQGPAQMYSPIHVSQNDGLADPLQPTRASSTSSRTSPRPSKPPSSNCIPRYPKHPTRIRFSKHQSTRW